MLNLFEKPENFTFLSLKAPLFNYILSGRTDGGFLVSRIAEVFGGDGSGKSTLGYNLLGSAQARGGLGVLIETENALSSTSWIQSQGVDISNLLLFQPESIDEVFSKIFPAVFDAMASLDVPSVIVWDSLASTHAEDSLDIVDAIRKHGTWLHSQIQKLNCILIIINQVRYIPDVGEITLGGRALKSLCSARLRLEKKEAEGRFFIGEARVSYSSLIPSGGICRFALDTENGGFSTLRSIKATFDALEFYKHMGKSIFTGWSEFRKQDENIQVEKLLPYILKRDF